MHYNIEVKTFYTYSFGCRVNEAEKEEIDRKMKLNGFSFNKDKPDIFIVNTCSVTNKAEREARQLIYQTKKKLPKAKIVVTGCSATYWLKNQYYQDIPADLMVGNINKDFLVDLILRRFDMVKSKKTIHSEVNPNTNKFIGSGRVMVKIQDGCQRFCTFCIVPYLRGMPKSAKIKDIVNKINLLAGGYPISEAILTAINTQAFGFDSKETFVNLLKAAVDDTEVPRISLGSLHPWSLTADFFDFYKRYRSKNRLVNFFHIPLQSGSDKILTLMKRGYKKDEILNKLIELQNLNPFILIATDVIVGFLEESEKDFKDTFDFLKQSPINKFHIFRFSKRTKTQADYMSKRLFEPLSKDKMKRAAVLIKLGQIKYAEFQNKNVGRNSTALCLEKNAGEYRECLLDNQLSIFVKTNKKPGDIINVKVSEFKKGRLFGRIV